MRQHGITPIGQIIGRGQDDLIRRYTLLLKALAVGHHHISVGNGYAEKSIFHGAGVMGIEFCFRRHAGGPVAHNQSTFLNLDEARKSLGRGE